MIANYQNKKYNKHRTIETCKTGHNFEYANCLLTVLLPFGVFQGQYRVSVLMQFGTGTLHVNPVYVVLKL